MTAQPPQPEYIITGEQLDTIRSMFSQPDHSMGEEDYTAREAILANILSRPAPPVNQSERLPPCPKCGAWTFSANIDAGYSLLCSNDACKWQQRIVAEPEKCQFYPCGATLGVGDGTKSSSEGGLFVHGSYDAIKSVQRRLFDGEQHDAEITTQAAKDEREKVLDEAIKELDRLYQFYDTVVDHGAEYEDGALSSLDLGIQRLDTLRAPKNKEP